MIILDLDDKTRPLSRSISHDSLLSLRQSKLRRISSPVPPDYHTSQLQAQAQATLSPQPKPRRRRFWPPSRRFRRIILYTLAVYFVLTAAIAVPVLVVKLRENNDYTDKSSSDSGTLSGLTPLATTLPNDAQYSQYYTSSVNGAPLECISYNIGTNATISGGPNSTVLGMQNTTLPPTATNFTYSPLNVTNSTTDATSTNYTMPSNGSLNTTVLGTGTITAQYTASTNSTIYIRTNATSALPNVYGNLNVTVAAPNQFGVNITQPLISISMAYNQSGAQNIVSLCTITEADELAFGIYIPEQLAETDFLNFQINVTLPNQTHYTELSTFLPSFNQVFNLSQYVTMDKLSIQGPMSNISLVSVSAGTLILKTPTQEVFNGQYQLTNTTPLPQ